MQNTNQKNCYKKDDGILIGGYAVTTVPSRSTVSLDSPNGAFFLAMAAGNNYGGCAYLVSSSYGGINNVFTLFEKNISATFEKKSDGQRNPIRANITSTASGKIDFSIYALT